MRHNNSGTIAGQEKYYPTSFLGITGFKEGTECFTKYAIDETLRIWQSRKEGLGTVSITTNQSLNQPYQLLQSMYQCRGQGLFNYWAYRDTIRFYFLPKTAESPENGASFWVRYKTLINGFIIVIIAGIIVLFIVKRK